MKSSRLMLLATAVFLFGCGKSNEYAAPPPPAVTVQAPAVRDVTTYGEISGRTAAGKTVEIRARVQGFLKTVDFQDGQLVEAGDLLFTIESEPFEAAVAAAEAFVASRQAELDLAEVSTQRTEQLFVQQAISELEMLEAQAARDAARGALKEAEAKLESARLDLAHTRVLAPISGRISRNYVGEGNLVGAGEATLLAKIVNDDPINVYLAVNERDLLPYLGRRPSREEKRERTRVLLQLSDGSSYAREGLINYGDLEVDTATGTLEIRAEFPNPDGKLVSGLFVTIRIPTERPDAMLVPEVAIQRDLGGHYVLTVGADNTVARTYVQMGSLIDGERIITGRLDASTRVIVNGLLSARPGATVNPAPAGQQEGG